jgi:Tol biopolymer transport system component
MSKQVTGVWLIAMVCLAACSAPRAASTPGVTATPTVPASSLTLSGRLIFTGSAQSLAQYDLADQQFSTLFEAPNNAFITAEAVSPDASRIVFSYAPPPQGTAQLGFSDLYTIPLEKSASPSPLVEGSAKQEVYSYPAWSPDGKYLYYGHTLSAASASEGPQGPRIERIAYPDGQPEIVQTGASYPRLSADGRRLEYITFKPDLSGNEVFVADPDGSNPVRLVPQTDFTAIDSPIFSPDARYVIFSAVGLPAASSTLDFYPWLGVQVAEAHNIPSDLWRVPVAGGQPERLTHVGCTGLFASFSPDGRYLAFMCDAGLFVMNPDGTNLGLLNAQGGIGTMEWIP